MNAPRQGGAPPQSRKLLIREKTWTAMMLAPRPTPADRQIKRRPVAGDDARHVGAVPAALGLERAGHGGSGTDLLFCAVRAERRALATPDVVE